MTEAKRMLCDNEDCKPRSSWGHHEPKHEKETDFSSELLEATNPVSTSILNFISLEM
jgi:hypothetical protein